LPDTGGKSFWQIPLKIRLHDELLVINILTVLLIIITAFLPVKALQIIFGLPLALFFPGYTLHAALFPHKETLNTLDRVALSFGLSIVVTPLIGLILNFTPWGIQVYSVLSSITLFIIIMSVIASLRRRQLSPEERFSVSFNFNLTEWSATSRLNKGLSITLILVILGTLGTLGYAISIREVGERFTQFYVLGLEGKPEGYPDRLKVGEEANVIVGIINKEGEAVSYRMEVTGNGITGEEIGLLILAHEDKWEREISFTPTEAGKNQKVEFLLYKQGESNPYREVHFWIEVIE